VAEVMIDYLACLFALALFLFLPSSDALCAFFFFGAMTAFIAFAWSMFMVRSVSLY
jgi:hypothetical protein